MTIYAGLDVSDKMTHICVVDSDGTVLRRDVVASDPDVLTKWFDRHYPGLVQVVLETGPLSTFLYHGLKERDVPVECICARHAKGVLATRVNKSDVHDAEGLAQLARTGWFKRVHMKASATHIDPCCPAYSNTTDWNAGGAGQSTARASEAVRFTYGFCPNARQASRATYRPLSTATRP